MAGFCRLRQFSRAVGQFPRNFVTSGAAKAAAGNRYSKYLVLLGGGLAVITYQKWKSHGTVFALQLRKVGDL